MKTKSFDVWSVDMRPVLSSGPLGPGFKSSKKIRKFRVISVTRRPWTVCQLTSSSARKSARPGESTVEYIKESYIINMWNPLVWLSHAIDNPGRGRGRGVQVWRLNQSGESWIWPSLWGSWVPELKIRLAVFKKEHLGWFERVLKI